MEDSWIYQHLINTWIFPLVVVGGCTVIFAFILENQRNKVVRSSLHLFRFDVRKVQCEFVNVRKKFQHLNER